jgi:hypothetical protein
MEGVKGPKDEGGEEAKGCCMTKCRLTPEEKPSSLPVTCLLVIHMRSLTQCCNRLSI